MKDSKLLTIARHGESYNIKRIKQYVAYIMKLGGLERVVRIPTSLLDYENKYLYSSWNAENIVKAMNSCNPEEPIILFPNSCAIICGIDILLRTNTLELETIRCIRLTEKEIERFKIVPT